MRTKIDVNDHTISVHKIIGILILYMIGVCGIGYIVTNDKVITTLQELTTPLLYNLSITIKNRLFLLMFLGVVALFCSMLYLCLPLLSLLMKGYKYDEILFFYKLKNKLKLLKRPLKKIRANIDEEYPIMYLEKQDNLYLLEIEKNHWFNKEQVEKNHALFMSVFNMQYWKMQEDHETIFMYFSHEEIKMTYKEFLKEYCHYSNEMIDDFIVLGYNDTGAVYLKYEDIPHAFIVGTTGTGKSNLSHVLIDQTKKIGAKIEALDGKTKELSRYKDDPQINVETDAKKFLMFIERVYKNMMNRHKYLEEQQKDYYFELGLEPVFFILEEITMILGVLSKNKKNKYVESDFQKADRLLTLIARAGRDAGIFIVATTQDPLTTNVSSALRGLLNCRILLCPVKEENIFDMMFGHGNRNMPKLKRGFGFIQTDGEVEIFQIPLFPIKQKSKVRPKKKSFL